MEMQATIILGIGVDRQPIEPIVFDVGIDPIIAEFSDNNLPLRDDSFDFVILADVLEHLEDPLRVLQESNRVLGKGGVVCLTTPNQANLKNRVKLLFGQSVYAPLEQFLKTSRIRVRERNVFDGHVREYTVSELREIMRVTGFEIRSLQLFSSTKQSIHTTSWQTIDGHAVSTGTYIGSDNKIERLSKNRILLKTYNLVERIMPGLRATILIIAEKH